jgi:hypothetical protein
VTVGTTHGESTRYTPDDAANDATRHTAPLRRRRLRRDGDGFFNRADGHLQREALGSASDDRDFARERNKSRQCCPQGVSAWKQVLERELAALVGDDAPPFRIRERHGDARKDAAGGIGDDARDAAAIGLGAEDGHEETDNGNYDAHAQTHGYTSRTSCVLPISDRAAMPRTGPLGFLAAGLRTTDTATTTRMRKRMATPPE